MTVQFQDSFQPEAAYELGIYSEHGLFQPKQFKVWQSLWITANQKF